MCIIVTINSIYYIIIIFLFYRHFFQLNIHRSCSSISSVRIKLSFATPDCINDLGTVSLYLVRNPTKLLSTETMSAGIENINDWFTNITYELLCGPVSMKTHVDISEQCIILSLAHPRLLQCEQQSIILLCFNDLFVSEYLEITEEATKSLTDKVPEVDMPINRRRLHQGLHQGYMSHPRLLRKQQQQQTTKLFPTNIHSSLQVTVFPYKETLKFNLRESLLKCIFYEDLVFKLVLVVCDYSIEESECCNLSTDIYSKEGVYTCEEVENRQSKALDILCWILSMAYCNGDR